MHIAIYMRVMFVLPELHLLRLNDAINAFRIAENPFSCHFAVHYSCCFFWLRICIRLIVQNAIRPEKVLIDWIECVRLSRLVSIKNGTEQHIHTIQFVANELFQRKTFRIIIMLFNASNKTKRNSSNWIPTQIQWYFNVKFFLRICRCKRLFQLEKKWAHSYRWKI